MWKVEMRGLWFEANIGKKVSEAGSQWLTHIIPATQEAKNRKNEVQGQLGK
jgi:hypothetical protein